MKSDLSKMGPPLKLPVTLYCGSGSDSRIDSSVGGVTLSGRQTHPIYSTQIFTLRLSEGPSARKQPPDNRWLQDSNYSQDQDNPRRKMCLCHWQFRAPLASVPATPRGSFWNTFWREYNSRTIWPTNWKLCRMIMHKLKLMCTKYDSSGGHFLGVNQ